MKPSTPVRPKPTFRSEDSPRWETGSNSSHCSVGSEVAEAALEALSSVTALAGSLEQLVSKEKEKAYGKKAAAAQLKGPSSSPTSTTSEIGSAKSSASSHCQLDLPPLQVRPLHHLQQHVAPAPAPCHVMHRYGPVERTDQCGRVVLAQHCDVQHCTELQEVEMMAVVSRYHGAMGNPRGYHGPLLGTVVRDEVSPQGDARLRRFRQREEMSKCEGCCEEAAE